MYFLSDVADSLNLSRIYAAYAEERGYPPYHPLLMVKLWLYGQMRGIRSPRKLERATLEDVPFRVLCAGNEPDHRTLSDFRRRHLDALGGLLVQVLQLCREADLVKPGHVAIDSTKIRANASKHKAMSYARMQEEEARLRAEAERMFAESDVIDAEEDARYGPDRRGDVLPPDLAHRKRRLEKTREAKAALERRAEEAARESCGRIPASLTRKERMCRKLRTKRGRAEYDKRKVTAEPVCGRLKDLQGIGKFLLRGLNKVQGEWLLACTGHNLLKLFRATQRRARRTPHVRTRASARFRVASS